MTVCQFSALTDYIAGVFGAALGDYREGFVSEIASGDCLLFMFDLPAGEYYAIVRPQGPVLVVCALAGFGSGSQSAIDYLFNMALGGGFDSVRFHTKRSGLHRMLKRYDPREVERVFEIGVSGGR